MASFPSGGAARGLVAGLSIRDARQARTQAKETERQRVIRENIIASRESAITGVTQWSELAAQVMQAGGQPEQIEDFRKGAEAVLLDHATALESMRALATKSGLDPEQIPSGREFFEQHISLFDASVQAATTKTATVQGQQTADQKTAELQRIAQNLGLPIEQVTQAAGVTPGPGTIREGMVDGRPAFVQQQGDRLTEVPGAQPIPSGISVEVGPDGGIRLQTGDQLPKPTGATLNTLQESVINSNEGLSRLFGIQASFKPEYLTFGGKIKGKWSDFKEKAGVDLNDDDKQFLEDFTTFSTNSVNNMNRYIKEITGAQMSEPEAERIRKGIPDPENDGPTQFKSKMDASTLELALTRARSLYVLRQGLEAKPWDVVGLDQMSKIIDARAAELEKKLGNREAALKQVAAEFGL